MIVLFIEKWGTLGWTLRDASGRADIVAAFTSADIPGHYASAVQPFRRSTARIATAADVRVATRSVNAAWKKTVEFENKLKRPAERVRQTLRALQQGVAAEQKAIVLAQHSRRLNEYAPLRSVADDHEEELRRLQTAQLDCEAAYSQDQLLSFLQKGKYLRNPRNLAYALAGLPQMGCAQSFKRSGKQKCWSWPSQGYCVFQMIERCADESPDRFKSALEASIRALPNRKAADATSRERLFGNWRYFRMAIDEALSMKGDPPERRPYRTFEIYMRMIGQGRDANEQLMVSLEELTDPLKS